MILVRNQILFTFFFALILIFFPPVKELILQCASTVEEAYVQSRYRDLADLAREHQAITKIILYPEILMIRLKRFNYFRESNNFRKVLDVVKFGLSFQIKYDE